jgi:hypothetical protein
MMPIFRVRSRGYFLAMKNLHLSSKKESVKKHVTHRRPVEARAVIVTVRNFVG